MKKILIITDIDFWRRGAGHRMRILKLVEFLANRTYLTIIYIGTAGNKKEESGRDDPDYTLVFLGENELLDLNQYGQRLSEYLTHHSFDFCIIEYIHNAFLLEYLPDGIQTILDTHDIISDRNESFREFGHEEVSFDLSKDLEFGLFDVFDYVMLISEPDLTKLKSILPEEKLILCPHPSYLCRHEIRREVKNIGFIGSEYLPNKDAVQYFINECWCAIFEKHPVNFTIYGNVNRALDGPITHDNILQAGYIDDIGEIYHQIDIVINPVRFGAGLKIKTVEALANGLPLVTSPHGARGLEKTIGHSFWVADQPADFIRIILGLIECYELRKETAKRAYAFMEENFSPEKCFEPLMRVIDEN